MVTDTALPASLSALHLALAMLRRHRAGGGSALSPFVLPSFLVPALPWIWPTPLVMVAGVVGHVIWMAICEVVAPAPVSGAAVRARPTSPPASARRPGQAPPSSPAATRAAGAPAPPASPRSGFQPTTVLAVLDESHDIRTFRLARPEGIAFEPGQFLPVRVLIDGKPHVRCYSISSTPATSGYLEISVRRQGLVSGTLHATLRPGALLAIGRPNGRFVYPAGDDRPLALLAGGIGITPLLSMLRHAVAAEPSRPVTLLYSARHERDVAFLDELRVVAARHPQVKVTLTLTQPTEAPRSGHESHWRTGRIDAAMIRQHLTAPAHTVFCMCGPAAMMADLSGVLTTLGVPASQVRFEHFETAVAASLVNPAAETERTRHDQAADLPTDSDGFRVTFAESGRSAVASPSMTLLEAAEAEGVAIPSSCRAGVCQACRTRLKDGRADCRSDVLDPDDRDAGYVLPCVTWVTGDCVLEA